MRFFPPLDKDRPGWKSRMDCLDKLEGDPTVVVMARYLLTLDELFDHQAAQLRTSIQRAEEAEEQYGRLQVQLAESELQAAEAHSRATAAEAALRTAEDRLSRAIRPAYITGRAFNTLLENQASPKAQYANAMEKKHGPNWRAEHPDFDAAVLYEEVGRTPHGRLAIGDEAISTTEKEHIKTRARRAHTHVSAREMRLQREVDSLRKRIKSILDWSMLCGHWLRKEDMTLMLYFMKMHLTCITHIVTSESDVGFSSKHERGGLDGIEQTDTNGGTYDGENDDYNDDGEGDEGNYDDEGNYHDGGYYYADHNDEYYAPSDKENLWD
ncbi:hypothetical protein EJB05_31564, partial [Eragrostis curvula]